MISPLPFLIVTTSVIGLSLVVVWFLHATGRVLTLADTARDENARPNLPTQTSDDYEDGVDRP